MCMHICVFTCVYPPIKTCTQTDITCPFKQQKEDRDKKFVTKDSGWQTHKRDNEEHSFPQSPVCRHLWNAVN